MRLSIVTAVNTPCRLCASSSVYPEVATTTLLSGSDKQSMTQIWQRSVKELPIKPTATDESGNGCRTEIFRKSENHIENYAKIWTVVRYTSP